MRYNYQYIVSVLEGQIERNEVDGTELNFLKMHKEAFERDFKEMVDLKNRWDKLEEHFKNESKYYKTSDNIGDILKDREDK